MQKIYTPLVTLSLILLGVLNIQAQTTFTLTDTIINQISMANYDAGTNSHPALFDYDTDGDLDLFIGINDVTNNVGDENSIRFLENTGNATTPQWTERDTLDNPFNGFGNISFLDVVTDATPFFVDIDNDGMMDAFIGNTLFLGAKMHQYEFNGASFSLITDGFLSLGEVAMSPSFGDIDTDGDYDLFIGKAEGLQSDVEVWLNEGTSSSPSFSFTGIGGVFNVNFGGTQDPVRPAFYDIDFDGDQDLFVGLDDGTITFYENQGNPGVPNFVLNATDNPFAGIDVGTRASVVFADIIGNDGIVEALIGSASGYVRYYTSNQGVYKEIASRTHKVSASDVASNGNGLDLTVNFDTAADESKVASYRILVVKTANAATFDLSTANAVIAANYTPVTKGTDVAGVYTTNLGALAKDIDGALIQGNVSYTVFVLSIATGTATANGLSAGDEVTLSEPAVAVSGLSTSDVANNGNGKDLQFSFTKASPETHVSEYRAYVVKTANAGTFTLNSAYSSSNYLALSVGKNVDTTFLAGSQDVDGDAVVIDVPYTVFVLSLGYGDTANSVLSSGSAITLTTPRADSALNVTWVDAGDLGNAGDFQVTFDTADNQTFITEYRIYITKRSVAATFNQTTAIGLATSRYTAVPVIKNQADTTLTLKTTQKDINGTAIYQDSLYNVFVLSVGMADNKNNNLSDSSAASVITTPRADSALNVTVVNLATNGNASDMQISFDAAPDETYVSQYRVIVVKADSAATFTQAKASALGTARYTVVAAPIGTSTTITLADNKQDADGVVITQNVAYRVFVLSDGVGVSTSKDNLSDSSASSVTLSLPMTFPATNLVLSQNGFAGNITDLDLSFDKATDESYMAAYRLLLVKTSDTAGFDVNAANTVIYNAINPRYVDLTPNGANQLYDYNPFWFPLNYRDAYGNVVTTGDEYVAYVLSVANGPYSPNNVLAGPSNVVVITPPVDSITVVTAIDGGSNGNASDIVVTCDTVEVISRISAYRVFVVKADSVNVFDQAHADTATVYGYYYDMTPVSGSYTSEHLSASTLDVDGDTIIEDFDYVVFIETQIITDPNYLFGPSDTVRLYPAVVAPAWDGIVASDIANNNSGEDLKVSFITPELESPILEYRVYAVVEEEAPDFALSDAEALTSIAYASVAPDGSDTLEVIFNFSSTDQTETDNLQEGIQYRIFVASIADTTKVSDPNAMEIYQTGYDGNLIELDPITGGDGVVDYALSKALRVYPSPAQTTITVSLEGQAGSMDIAIYNMKGELLLNAAASQSKSIINVTSLTSGNYILKVSNGDKVAAKLFVKE